MNALIQLIHREKDHGWAVQLEILIFVYWLAHGLSFRLVARVFDVPAGTTHRVVHNIARQLMENLDKVTSLPKPEEMVNIGQSFGELARNAAFNKAVGSIGCCHMHVKPSGSRCRVDYINDTLSFSIRFQSVCDAAGKFLDIFVGYPGSVHDSRVLKSSPLYTGTRYPPSGFVIVGNDEYPCLEEPVCLITPYKFPLQGRAQERFNLHLSRLLSVTQKSFRMMKTRWRSTLFKAMEVNPDFAPSVISACAFIHNVCLMNTDVVEPDPNLRNQVMGPLPPPDPLGPDEKRGDLMAAVDSVTEPKMAGSSDPGPAAVEPTAKPLPFKDPSFVHSGIGGAAAGKKNRTWKNLKQILAAERALPWQLSDPNYYSIDAPPSFKPAKKYSDISGLPANYTDPQTKLRFTSSEEFSYIRLLPTDVVTGYLALRKATCIVP